MNVNQKISICEEENETCFTVNVMYWGNTMTVIGIYEYALYNDSPINKKKQFDFLISQAPNYSMPHV